MRKIVSFLLAVLLLCSLGLTASAAGGLVLDGYVTDACQLLTAGEEAALEQKAQAVSEKYDRGVYIIVVEDYTCYGSYDLYTTAGDLYLANGLGLGRYQDGMLLMLSMHQREAALITRDGSGQFVTAYGKEWLAEQYLDDFRQDDWAAGFEAYVENSGALLKMAAKGRPMDALNRPGVATAGFFISLLLAFGIASIIMLLAKYSMRSVFKAATAREYVAQGGVSILDRSDVFSHRNTHTRIIQRSGSGRSGGSSGGSRGTDSRGFSGRSDRF